jgi:hypothetical protein
MDARAAWAGVALLLGTTAASAQELVWRPSKDAAPNFAPPPSTSVTLSRPQPLADFIPKLSVPTNPEPAPIVRAQAGDPPPPPPFTGGPGVPPGAPVGPFTGPTPYNCGQVNSNADLGFWSNLGQMFKRCWGDTTGAVGGVMQPGQGRNPFQSDHTLDVFASPVTNPFYSVDPRALTEIKPLFIWQHTPNSNPYWNGGDNYFAGVTGSVAFTPWLSLTVNKLGFTWINPHNGLPVGISSHGGFSEVQLGPKVTFIRDCNTGTAAAFGLVFEIPVGSSGALQDTGSLSLRPYFSFAQNFGKSQYGSFNFMNTTGYDFAVDNQRNDFLFSNFHIDYDIANKHVFYPLIELNWIFYPDNGGQRDFGFGGGDLFNFGSNGTAGHDELTLAAGFRWKPWGETVQFGLAAQFNVLGDHGNGRHLDTFRLTADVIFRY